MARLAEYEVVKIFVAVLAVVAEFGKKDVVYRTEDDGDAEHDDGDDEGAEIQLPFRKAAGERADEQKVRRRRGRREEEIIEEAVEELEMISPAVVEAELFADAPKEEEQLVYQVLRRIGVAAAKQHDLVRLVKTQAHISRE